MGKKIKISLCVGLFLVMSFCYATVVLSFADDFFSSDDLFVEETEIINDEVGKELEVERVGFSGEMYLDLGYVSYLKDYDWFGLGKQNLNKMRNSMKANFLLDVRLTNGIKGFVNFGATCHPAGVDNGGLSQEGDTHSDATKKCCDLQIKEIFIDTNWDRKVYFRIGKQFIQWGQGYFWNPTDLINAQRREFFAPERPREGAYGLRVQIPFGISKNLFFFTGMDHAELVDDLPWSGKYEFLLGNTEMSLSAWVKKNYHPVYGLDFSGRVSKVDFQGEIGLSHGSDNKIMDYNSLEVTTEGDRWVPKISLGFTRCFTHNQIKERVRATMEFYYNEAGYDKNIFARVAGTTLEPMERLEVQKKFLEVYEPFMNFRYYLAYFCSLQKFITADNTLYMKGITNLADGSSSLSIGVSYNPALTDMVVDFAVNAGLGDKYTEATFLGDRRTWRLLSPFNNSVVFLIVSSDKTITCNRG